MLLKNFSTATQKDTHYYYICANICKLIIMSKVTANQLVKTIIEAIREKKGKNIVTLDFKKIENAICRFYVICEGDSSTQVDAIADEIEDYTRKKTGEKIWGSAGYENAEWIFLDYGDVIVHVFQPHIRQYYNLEDLWADCTKKTYPNEE